ncbi:hypothetical protein SLEP1_g17544 [Rubroshorea leprosula]|uniref:Uncharacterized protein n=1 Tax=Rubroshorea leprosula TaxID=152421 RepID=A0AAV5IUL2_9ROSI|nr:hypothetical protein SLEP1_g17542 [Rubroshorea leprosula]GKV05544.1 hypothetical protein SLEP1_g17544 [Rubroshorea leprosula]
MIHISIGCLSVFDRVQSFVDLFLFPVLPISPQPPVACFMVNLVNNRPKPPSCRHPSPAEKSRNFQICSALPPLSVGFCYVGAKFLSFSSPKIFCTSRRQFPQSAASICLLEILVLLWLRALGLSPRFMRFEVSKLW